MKVVADYAHSKGLVFGLYTCGGSLTCVGNRPGSKDHWTQDAAVWAEWGIDSALVLFGCGRIMLL